MSCDMRRDLKLMMAALGELDLELASVRFIGHH